MKDETEVKQNEWKKQKNERNGETGCRFIRRKN